MSSSPFPGFDRLSPILYLYTPISTETSTNPPHPELIILATWMNAPPKLINLYASSYRQHFPNSQILLITAFVSHLFLTSAKTYDALLRPALPLLNGVRGKLVAAVYSNGGAIALSSLASLYASSTGKPLPLRGLLFDSAPGSGSDLASGRRAIFSSFPPVLPRGFIRYLFLALLAGILGVLKPIMDVLRIADPLTTMRKSLLDPAVVSKGGKRAYIFSQEDEMVNAKAVLQHANQSEGRGWEVRTELWTGSGHVAHARADPERYWKVSKETIG